MIYQMHMAGHTVRYRLRRRETASMFPGEMEPADGEQYDVAVDDAYMEVGRRYLAGHSDPYVECKLLSVLTSLPLLRHNACIFHAVAFVWRGLAWLLTGPSGTGKSTQYVGWKTLYGGEVELICGDMPVLEVQPDGSVRAFPSPWKGKERWNGAATAPLGGIICLEQAEENAIERMEPARSVVPLLRQFICVPTTEAEIHAMTALADRMVSDHPVWLLRNRGDSDSVRLCRRTLEAHLSERSEG